jgi:hypothetical protein
MYNQIDKQYLSSHFLYSKYSLKENQKDINKKLKDLNFISNTVLLIEIQKYFR